MLAFDLYDRGPDYTDLLKNCAEKVSEIASEKGKIAAVSEAGGPIATDTTWWTDKILQTLKSYELSYILVWRNPFRITDHHSFAPYKNSPDAENFVKFYKDPGTLFQTGITGKKLYE